MSRALRGTALAVTAVAMVAGIGAGGTAFVARDGESETARADAPTLERPAEPSTSTTVAAGPALPTPEPPPADEYEDVPVVEIGQIEIPRIGLVHTIYEGVWLTVVDHGPGHWPGTAEPGGYGNSVFAGHRVTNSHPFRRIDELAPGDEIIVRTAQGTFVYQATDHEIVDETGLHIIDQAPGQTITLFACHPPGSAQYRYVVRGTLVRTEAPPA